MKVVCLTFTYPFDEPKAKISASLLPREWRKVWCVESRHAAEMRPPEGVELIVRDFPRGTSLRYAPAVNAMAKIYRELGAECDALVKLDSDTVLFRPSAWTAPIEHADADFVYLRRHQFESRLLANGCCYAMSRRAIATLDAFPETHQAQFSGHEDMIFSAWFTTARRELTLCQLDKAKFYWHTAKSMSPRHFGGHYGYTTSETMRTLVEDHLAIFRGEKPEFRQQ